MASDRGIINRNHYASREVVRKKGMQTNRTSAIVYLTLKSQQISHINITGAVLAASSLEGDDKMILFNVAVAFSSRWLLHRSEVCRESCYFMRQAAFSLPPPSLPFPSTDRLTKVHRTSRNVETHFLLRLTEQQGENLSPLLLQETVPKQTYPRCRSELTDS